MPLWYLEGHTAFSLLLRALWEEFGIFKSIPHSTGEAGQNEKKNQSMTDWGAPLPLTGSTKQKYGKIWPLIFRPVWS